jgi:hypothetical protein
MDLSEFSFDESSKLPIESLDEYLFPVTNENISILEGKVTFYSASEMIDKLQKLSYETYDELVIRKSYAEVRSHLCNLGIFLNLQGSIAPRFRPMRKPIRPGASRDYPIEHILLHNDRQVIDLHWIRCQKLNANHMIGYKDLFDFYKLFDFEKASLFAFKAGSKERKARLLGLSEFEQFQLAANETQEVKTRWKTITNYCDKNQSKIKDLFTRSSSRVSEEMLNELPNIHKALLIARGSPSKAGKIYSKITAKELSEKSFQRYANRFKEAKLII